MADAEAELVGQTTDFTSAIEAAVDAAELEDEQSADAEYKRVLFHKIGAEAIGRAVARARGEDI